jgi:uncharacterized protein (DUF885 family)
MRLSRRAFGTGLAGAVGLAPAVAAAQDASQALTAFLDAEYQKELRLSPERLSGQGSKEFYSQLTDRSEAQAERVLAWRRQSVADMRARFDPARLNEEARTSYDMWVQELARAEKAHAWRGYSYLFDRDGDHTGLPNFMINSHRVDSRADMDAYNARVGLIGPALDQLLMRAKRSAAMGVRMPRFAYDQSLGEIARLMTGAPFGRGPDSALYADAKAKVGALRAAGKINQVQADALLKETRRAMTAKMKPAYDRLRAWLTADKALASAEPRGVGALPNGAAYYNAMLSLQTTTDMTAEEIHAVGLREVARIRGEMEALKAKIGFTGPLAEFFVFLRTDKRFYVAPTDAGRREYLGIAERNLAEIKPLLPRYFSRQPKADLVVRRVEAFREEPGGAAHYSPGARDGSRPGVFYVHLSDVMATPIYEIEGTAYHEGLPGHHMQISIAQELTGLPRFRTQYRYIAYSEGWGLYSEGLAKEMGRYQDPYSDFGRLSREIWRAIRMVLDTGIHAKGWSEAQAVAFYSENSPQPRAKIVSEVRRYFVTPGQATTYMVGQLKIQALRDAAKAALGARFDYRAFHEVLLGGGALPLPVLETRVDRWVEQAKRAA